MGIFDAIWKGDLKKIRELYTKDTQIIKSRTNTGETPLHIASLQGKHEIADFLCIMGLYISFLKRDGSWDTPKSIAETAGISPCSQGGKVSFDRRFLFFVAPYTVEFGVYWVKADFINRMKFALFSE